MNPKYVNSSLLEELLAFLDDVDIRSTLFVIPSGLFAERREDDYVRLLGMAMASGHEIALHGCRHTNNEFGHVLPIPLPGFRRQKELLTIGQEYLRESLGQCALGFRAPQYRHNRMTFNALETLGFKYDSSRTVFKPSHGVRFRFKTRFLPKVTKLGSLCEIPVTGDYAYNLDRGSYEVHLGRAIADFNWTRSIGGTFVVNNHVNRSGRAGLQLLHALIDQLRDETDFVTLRDLVVQFNSRFQAPEERSTCFYQECDQR